MVIEPKTRGFICTTAHPAGCSEAVRQQINYIKSMPRPGKGAKKALIIGASTGYGLSSRIAAAYGCGAATLGIIFDRPASGSRTATAGWYNTAAFESFASRDGLYAKTINGDAFSKEVKEETIRTIRDDLGLVDLIVYSLAAPRRTMPDGTVVSSVLKTTGVPFTNKTINLKDNTVSEITVPPASEQEIADTVKVMGGEDWEAWIGSLHEAGVLADGAVTVAYSYLGPSLTHPIYQNGSIGQAKQHLFNSSKRLAARFPGLTALVSVNKALVTQSSAAIPVVPLYISILYKVMKDAGLHEGCIEQMYRLFYGYYEHSLVYDSEGRVRLDDREMLPEIQNKVDEIWNKVTDETVSSYCDIEGYWDDFYRMFGFRLPGVDYAADVDPAVPISSIPE